MTTKLEEQSAQVGLNISWEKTKVMRITQHPSSQPIAVEQGNIEYVERCTYLGIVISRDGDVEADINTRLAKAAAVFQRLDNVWRSSSLRLKIKLDLCTPLIVSTAIYTSETWKSTARIRQQLDVFQQRNLRKIWGLGITWKDHVTNMEVLSRIGQRRLQDIVAERRLRMAGRMPPGRPANHAMSWTLVVVADDEVVQRRRGGLHLKRTWWTEESIGTASGLWLQTGADGELLLPIVLSRTGRSKC